MAKATKFEISGRAMMVRAPTSRSRLRWRLAPLDLLWVAAAPLIALDLRDASLLQWSDFPRQPPDPYLFAFVTVVCAIPALIVFRLSDGMRHMFSVPDLFAVCAAVSMTVSSSALLTFTVTRLDGVPRSTPLIYALVLGGGLIGGRTVSRILGAGRAKARVEPARDNLRRVILVGADRLSSSIVKLLDGQTPQTSGVVAILDGRATFVGRSIEGVPVAGAIGDLDDIIEEYGLHGVDIDAVWISEQAFDHSDVTLAVVEALCARRGIECRGVSDIFSLKPKLPRPVSTRSVVDSRPSPTLPRYFRAKRAVDILISGALIVALAPLWLLAAGLVLLDVGTPVHFWQERVGRGGRRLLVYKFRTYQAPFGLRGEALSDGDRLSAIGRLVRKTRLDELPQLLTVLLGDMSLIGPRPLLTQDQPKDPSVRLAVRPGITGWAQVCGGNLVSAEERAALDEYYVRHASLRFDIEILALTLMVILRGERRNATALRRALAANYDPGSSHDVPCNAGRSTHALP